MPRDAVSRTANVGTVGTIGLRHGEENNSGVSNVEFFTSTDFDFQIDNVIIVIFFL